jgi:hypothetical protein
MYFAALSRVLFWPRLGPLARVFFESRRAAARKIDCHMQSALESPLCKHIKKSGAIVYEKAQHFNERHKGCITHLKGQNCLFALGFFSNSIPLEALFSCC